MVTAYSLYSAEQKKRTKANPLADIYPPLPNKRYAVIYADPPWDYGGKMQYDETVMGSKNKDFKRRIFLSSAAFEYPTLTLKQLATLDVPSIMAENCLLFLWVTGPQMANAVKLGMTWGFEYKTVAFVWNKRVHNPGRYTLSQTEFVFVFKRGRFPRPRGARNVRQMIEARRKGHSVKPIEVIDGITRMFPTQDKIELFARRGYAGWDSWGLEAPAEEMSPDTKTTGKDER